MVLAFRNQPVLNHSLIDTMKLFRGFGYRAFELEVVRGLTDIIALDYLEDYTIEKVNKVSEENTDQKPDINYNTIHSNMVVTDVIFNDPNSLFLREAKCRGAKTINGLGMLARQAALNFKLWTGVDAPQELMIETLKREFNL